MNRFEDELSEALRRREPPPGFADRVMARMASPPTARGFRRTLAGWFRTPAVRWAAAAACCLLLLAGFEIERRREMQSRGEAAKEQLMLAVRIAGSKLQLAQAKVHEAGERRVRLPERSL